MIWNVRARMLHIVILIEVELAFQKSCQSKSKISYLQPSSSDPLPLNLMGVVKLYPKFNLDLARALSDDMECCTESLKVNIALR